MKEEYEVHNNGCSGGVDGYNDEEHFISVIGNSAKKAQESIMKKIFEGLPRSIIKGLLEKKYRYTYVMSENDIIISERQFLGDELYRIKLDRHTSDFTTEYIESCKVTNDE